MAEEKKKKKNKTGATGKKYTQIGDTIKVTYTDGSTRTVSKRDKSYSVTKDAMDKDKGVIIPRKGNSNSVTAKTALGSGWTEGGVGRISSVENEKKQSQYLKKAKEANESKKKQQTSTLEKAKAVNKQVEDVHREIAKKGVTTKSLGHAVDTAKVNIKNNSIGGATDLAADLSRGGMAEAAPYYALAEKLGVMQPGRYNRDMQQNVDAFANLRQKQAQQEAAARQAVNNKYGPLNGAEQFVSDVGSNVLQMGPAMAMNVIPGLGSTLGRAYMFNLARGAAANQALNSGATYDQANAAGIATGAAELGTEALFDGIKYAPKGWIDPAKYVSKISNPTAKAAADMALRSGGESLEEILMAYIEPAIQRATYNPEAENPTLMELLYTGAVGAVAPAVINTTLGGVGKAANALADRTMTGSLPSQNQPEQANSQPQAQEPMQESPQPQNVYSDKLTKVANAMMQKYGVEVEVNGSTEYLRGNVPPEAAADLRNRGFRYNQQDGTWYRQRTKPEQAKIDKAMQQAAADSTIAEQNNAVEEYQNAANEVLQEQEGIDQLQEQMLQQNAAQNAQNQPEMANVQQEGQQANVQRNNQELLKNPVARGEVFARTLEQAGATITKVSNKGAVYLDNKSFSDEEFEVIKNIAKENGYRYRSYKGQRRFVPVSTNPGQQQASPVPEIKPNLPKVDATNEQTDAASVPEAQNIIEQNSQQETQANNNSWIDGLKDYDLSKIDNKVMGWLNRIGTFDSDGGKVGKFDVAIVDGIPDGAHGKYIPSRNLILLDGNKLNSKKTAAYVLGHEVYHGLIDTKEHGYIQDLAKQFYGLPDEQLLDAMRQTYKNNGEILESDDAVWDEIGAEFIQHAIEKPDDLIRMFNENPSVLEKIMYAIDDAIRRLKSIGLSKQEKYNLQLLQKARSEYRKALSDDGVGTAKDGLTNRSVYLGKNADGIEVYEVSPEIKKLSYDARRKKFQEIIEKDYAGRTARFIANGKKNYARFSPVDINKNLYGDEKSTQKGYDAKVALGADGNIFDLVERAKYLGSKQESGKPGIAHKDVKTWDYFHKDVIIDSQEFSVFVNVRRKEHDDYIYNIVLQEKDGAKKTAPPAAVSTKNSVKKGADRLNNANISNNQNAVNTKQTFGNGNRSSYGANSEFDKLVNEGKKTKAPKLPNERYIKDSDENLRKFMEGSQVVNEDGSPKVVYSGHGNSSLFGDSFDIKKATSGGFYFTESADIASSYANDKLGNMERYENGEEYRFKNDKGDFKRKISDIYLTDEQVARLEEMYEDGEIESFDDYVANNYRYDRDVAMLRYNGGKRNLLNLYKFHEMMGDTANGWDYTNNKQINSTFEDIMDDLGIEWDSYTKKSPGVFPVYLNIKNPIDTSKDFPADLMYALEQEARKEKTKNNIDADNLRWTKDYPLKNWVERIKEDDGTATWATQVPTKARKIMLQMGYDGIKDTGGKMGGAEHTVWIALEPNQVKSAIGNRGTYDASKKSMRSSFGVNSQFEQLLAEYGAMPKGENPHGTNRDIDVPDKIAPHKDVQQFIRTALESDAIDEISVSAIERGVVNDLESGKFTYTPESNASLLSDAAQGIAASNWYTKYKEFIGKVEGGAKVTSKDVATAELLIAEAQNRGKYNEVTELVAALSTVGREMGQGIQALRILKNFSPEGQLVALYKTIDRINSMQTEKTGKAIDVDKKAIAEEFLKARSAKRREEIRDRVLAEMAAQSEGSWMDKLDAIRYAAMLSNPKTHVRNMIGNFAMQAARVPKNTIAAALEGATMMVNPTYYEQHDRLHAPVIRQTMNKTERKKLNQYVNDNFEEIGKSMLQSVGSRYNDPNGVFSSNRRVFGKSVPGRVLEQFAGNGKYSVSNVLEAEDMMFKEITYKQVLKDYMKANGITAQDARNGVVKPNGASLEKGMKYAYQEAKKATFTEDNKFTKNLSKLENTNAVSRILVGGTVPFKRTPANIITRGVEYSPAGLAMTGYKLVDMMRKAKDGKSKYQMSDIFDSLGANVTGTAILALGISMAAQGLLHTTGDDDDDKLNKLDSQMGSQNYSFVSKNMPEWFQFLLPDGSTYTLDWLAPVAMPLFTGAEVYNQLLNEDKDLSLNQNMDKAIESLMRLADPVFEMSMMQGVAEALASYSGDAGDIASSLMKNMLTGYAGQFIPQPMAAVARSLDTTVRSSYASKDENGFQYVNKFVNQQKAKIPGASKQLQPSIDMWGNERKRELSDKNIAIRLANNLLNPGNFSSNKRTKLENELTDLYHQTGESKVLPSTVKSTLDYGGEKYNMSRMEYARYAKTKGQSSAAYISQFIDSPYYNKLSDGDKAKIVGKMYDLANYKAKKELVKGRNKGFKEDSSMEKILSAQKDYGVSPAKYMYTREVLYNNYDYETSEKVLNSLDKLSMSPSTFAEVMTKAADLYADKNAKGNSIRGSKQKKLYALCDAYGLKGDQKKFIYEMDKMSSMTIKKWKNENLD